MLSETINFKIRKSKLFVCVNAMYVYVQYDLATTALEGSRDKIMEDKLIYISNDDKLPLLWIKNIS